MNGFGFVILLLYIFCFLWRPQDYIQSVSGWPVLFALEMAALVIWFFGRRNLAATQYKFILGLMITLFISNTLSEGVSLGFEQAKDFLLLQVLVFVLVANGVTTVKRQRWLFITLIVGSLVMVLHTFDQVLDQNKIGWTGVQMLRRNDVGEGAELWQPRYLGVFNDPNDLGLMFVSVLPFIAYFYLQGSRTSTKFWLGLAMLLHLIAIYLLNSRGTLLGVFAMGAVWGILRYGGFKLLIRFVLVIPFIPLIVPARFYVSGDDSASERIDAWYEGTQMLLSHPLFGVGKGGFLDNHYITAHNSWVLIFAELGYVGYYFWVALIFSSLYFAWYCQRDFADTGLPLSKEKAYLIEKNLATTVMYSMIGTMVCAFFISRSYVTLIYILPAIAVGQYQRFQIDFKEIKFKPMAKNMLLVSLGFFVLINLIVRLNL